MAFGRRVGFWINIDGVVGTGLHAGFAADTHLRIELDDAVGTLVHGRNRADAHARGVSTVVAACHLKMAASIGKRAFFDVFNPGAIDPQRNLIFGFAGRAAGVTANAGAIIYNKAIIHAGLLARTMICLQVNSVSA
jgi:hypothetical protein